MVMEHRPGVSPLSCRLVFESMVVKTAMQVTDGCSRVQGSMCMSPQGCQAPQRRYISSSNTAAQLSQFSLSICDS